MKRALILIDYINEIVNPAGKTPACAAMFAANNSIDKINDVTKKARADGWMVIWVKVAFSADYREIHPNSKLFANAKKYGAYLRDSWATELVGGLDCQPTDVIVYKNRVSAFFATNLDLVLKANNIEELYIAGVSTEMAIQATVRAAHDLDYKVNIVGDLCASGSLKLHNSSLEMLGRVAEIINSTDIVDA